MENYSKENETFFQISAFDNIFKDCSSDDIDTSLIA